MTGAATDGKLAFLKRHRFPTLWQELDMFPDGLWAHCQHHSGLPGGHASEHIRHAALHWWLRQQPLAKETVDKLRALAEADPDHAMGSAFIEGYLGP